VPDATVSPFGPSDTEGNAPDASAWATDSAIVEDDGSDPNADTVADASTAPEIPTKPSATAGKLLLTVSFDMSGANGGTVSFVSVAPVTTDEA